MEDFGRFSHHRDLGERGPRGAHARPARGEGSEASGTPWPPRRRRHHHHHQHQCPRDASPRESRSLSDVAAPQRPPERPREAWGEPGTLRCCPHCPPVQGDSPPPHPDGACTPLSTLFGADDEAPIGDPWALPAAGLDRWSLSSLPSEEQERPWSRGELRMLSCKRGLLGGRLAAPFSGQPPLQRPLQPAPSGREARGGGGGRLHTQTLKDKLDEAVLSPRDREIVALVLARLQKARRMRELQREAAAAWEELRRSDRRVQATLERERRRLLQRGRAQWQRGGLGALGALGERSRARHGHAMHADGPWGAPEDHDLDAQQQQQHQDQLERVPKPRRPAGGPPVLQRLLWERERELGLEQELEEQEQELELELELEVEKMRARRRRRRREAAAAPPPTTPKPRRPGPVLQRRLWERELGLEQERELEKKLEKTRVCTEATSSSSSSAPKPRRPGSSWVQQRLLRLREQELELELQKNVDKTLLSQQCKQPSLEQHQQQQHQQQQQQQHPARRLVPSSTTTITTTRTTTTCPKQQQQQQQQQQQAPLGHKKVREANLSSLVNFQARQVLMDCQVKAEELLRRLSLEQSAQRAQEQLQGGLQPPRGLREEVGGEEGEQCQQELEEQRRVRRRLLRRLAAEQKVQQARELRSHHHVLKLKAEKEEKCHVEGIKEAVRKKEQRTEQLGQDQGAQLRGGGGCY